MHGRVLVLIAVLGLATCSSGCASLARFLAERTPGVETTSTGVRRTPPDAPPAPGVDRSETLANLDAILERHPEAANRSELQDLRQELAEEGGDGEPVRGESSVGMQGQLSQGEGVAGTPRPPLSRHDRRLEDWSRRGPVGQDPVSGDIVSVQSTSSLSNRFGLGREEAGDPVMGYHDNTDLTAVPPGTSFEAVARRISLQELGGVTGSMVTTDPAGEPFRVDP